MSGRSAATVRTNPIKTRRIRQLLASFGSGSEPDEVEQRSPSVLVRGADDVVRHLEDVGRTALHGHRDRSTGEHRYVVVAVSDSEHLRGVDARESAVRVDSAPFSRLPAG
jgi:hypothetical protein